MFHGSSRKEKKRHSKLKQEILLRKDIAHLQHNIVRWNHLLEESPTDQILQINPFSSRRVTSLVKKYYPRVKSDCLP